ncbi:uncharacterized protein K489DRAFT_378983 [Dissoconium aciculare CBS 342.82]|jgi:hypothetical protein|uniref:Uncharacterized protein n=1 Tax=Dissoconium aciculare CBS 342.82 TaxID=1314786 RepID=A0A6J3MCJ0_9PEZI|nr:uncharacterized protein K489DRAFT_378983 [Dissoconium aciculare CBS 342.82]KAF1824552.1 hypothetical protein K489DRAFT_378983 [Dissoconium aciculare CBS 342.82]
MCFVTVKDLEVDPPARRVKEVRRVIRDYPSLPPPPRISETMSRTTIIEQRRPPSPSRTEVRAPSVRAPPSVAATRASQRYVQVEVEAESDRVSVSSSDEVLSQTTRRSEGASSRATHQSLHTRVSSHPRAPSVPAPPSVRPRSEYSVHEREREITREYPPRPEYETYRYVDAPQSRVSREHRRSVAGDPRMSDESYRQLQVSIKNSR